MRDSIHRDLLDQAARAAGALVDVRALQAVVDNDHAAVLAVVGRRSVGKSSLVNALVPGASCAVGMGGVTSAVRLAGDAVFDTPAIENALDGADMLEALLPQVDALVWLVDGLQPLTALEREAFDDAVPYDIAVHVLVSRVDLLGEQDRDAVLDRVRALTRKRAPLTVAEVDPRDPSGGLMNELFFVCRDRSPRRRSQLLSALADVQRSLSHLPEPPSVRSEIERIVGLWQLAAKEALDATRDEVLDGQLLFTDQARKALVVRLTDAMNGLSDQERARLSVAPSWRPAQVPDLDLWAQTSELMSGTAGVIRAVEDAAVAELNAGEQAWAKALRGPAGQWLQSQGDALRQARSAVQAATQAIQQPGQR